MAKWGINLFSKHEYGEMETTGPYRDSGWRNGDKWTKIL